MRNRGIRQTLGVAVAGLLVISSAAAAAQYDRDRDARDRDRIARLDPGLTIMVRTNEAIDSNAPGNRVYYGVVDQDVRANNGQLAIPRGSTAELIVRPSRENRVVLDLESITVNGQRYAVQTDPNAIAGTTGSNDIVGSIINAIPGIGGLNIRVPRGTEVGFRLERPLDVGVPDRGVMRNGQHYHDYYNDGNDRRY